MQWDATAPQAGFSTNSTTWLPVASNYGLINVQTESKDPTSLLNWYKRLIAMRREMVALRDGGMVMVDTANANVLSYVRTAPAGGHAVVVTLNMTAHPQKIALDLSPAGISSKAVRTLLTDQSSLEAVTTTSMILPEFGSWLGEVQ